MKSLIVRLAAGGAASLIIGAGVAGASTITFVNTGPFSFNSATVTNTVTVTRVNTNVVGVNNINNQSATSGSANVFFNTIGGSAVSGSVSNANCGFTTVSITN